MAKTYLERMGLYPVGNLTKEICLKRVAVIKRGLKANKYRGILKEKAKYYFNWYSWMAANGGNRPTHAKRLEKKAERQKAARREKRTTKKATKRRSAR